MLLHSFSSCVRLVPLFSSSIISATFFSVSVLVLFCIFLSMLAFLVFEKTCEQSVISFKLYLPYSWQKCILENPSRDKRHSIGIPEARKIDKFERESLMTQNLCLLWDSRSRIFAEIYDLLHHHDMSSLRWWHQKLNVMMLKYLAKSSLIGLSDKLLLIMMSISFRSPSQFKDERLEILSRLNFPVRWEFEVCGKWKKWMMPDLSS